MTPISGGSLVKVGTGTLTLTGANNYTGGTTLAGGVISVSNDSGLGNAAGALTFTGGTLQVTGTSYTSMSRAITLGAGGGSIEIADAANTLTVWGAITGTGGLTKLGAGALSLFNNNNYSGATLVAAVRSPVISSNLAPTARKGPAAQKFDARQRILESARSTKFQVICGVRK
jgi:autotransporter-associated beta strand protein